MNGRTCSSFACKTISKIRYAITMGTSMAYQSNPVCCSSLYHRFAIYRRYTRARNSPIQETLLQTATSATHPHRRRCDQVPTSSSLTPEQWRLPCPFEFVIR